MNANTATTTDLITTWAADIRALVITPVDAGLAAGVVGAVTWGAAAGVSVLAPMSATAGGTSMSTAMIAGSAAAHTGVKVAAGCLAAALAAGGTAAATGNLPTPAQSFAANVAAHVGINLPKPDATVQVGGQADTAAQTISVGEAGSVGVTLDGGELSLASIDANAGYSASVLDETADSILVQFQSDKGAVSVLISNIDGAITASVTGEADAGASSDGSGSTMNGKADSGVETQSTLDAGDDSASIDGSADAGLEITLGG